MLCKSGVLQQTRTTPVPDHNNEALASSSLVSSLVSSKKSGSRYSLPDVFDLPGGAGWAGGGAAGTEAGELAGSAPRTQDQTVMKSLQQHYMQVIYLVLIFVIELTILITHPQAITQLNPMPSAPVAPVASTAQAAEKLAVAKAVADETSTDPAKKVNLRTNVVVRIEYDKNIKFLQPTELIDDILKLWEESQAEVTGLHSAALPLQCAGAAREAGEQRAPAGAANNQDSAGAGRTGAGLSTAASSLLLSSFSIE